MSTRSPGSDLRRPRDRRLIALLLKADRAVRRLQVRAASICQSGNLEILGFRRRQLEELGALLDRGAQVLGGRLRALEGAPAAPPAEAAEHISRNAFVEPITFLASYRACCRALCAAMKEAARLADSSSVLSLRALILQLEKQLWMIDVPECARGREDRRSVALFLSC